MFIKIPSANLYKLILDYNHNMAYIKPGQKKEVLSPEEEEQQQISRIKLPKDRQIFGVVERRLGASRMEIKCLDGKSRVCRIPGRMKRFLWVRENDIVIVEPWEYDTDKGDVLFKYTKTQVNYLKNKGYLRKLDELQEF